MHGFADGLLRLVVCKLVGQYKENQADTDIAELHGTGWLMAKDLVVTAGHVIYDSKDKWGGLTSIKVYVGYSGNDHSNLESRYGKFVAVPLEWIKDSSAQYDVGFVSFLSPETSLDTLVLLTLFRRSSLIIHSKTLTLLRSWLHLRLDVKSLLVLLVTRVI